MFSPISSLIAMKSANLAARQADLFRRRIKRHRIPFSAEDTAEDKEPESKIIEYKSTLMPTELNAEHIKKVIEIFVGKNKRIPKPSELSPILEGMDARKIQPYILQYVKNLDRLTVMPDGKVVDDEGKPVWYRNSAGSLTLARYKKDEQLGNHVTG